MSQESPEPPASATPQPEAAAATKPAPETEAPASAQPEAKPAQAPAPQKKMDAADLDFVADTKAAFLEEKSTLVNLVMFGIIGMVAAFTFWASQAEIDESTKSQGKVVPSDALQIVQSLEGGLLAEMNVKEGDTVSKGQALLRIDDTGFSSVLTENVVQRDSLQATFSRLDAEARSASEIDFPASLSAKRPDLVTSEIELFTARRENLATNQSRLSKSLELKLHELEITRPLAETGVVSQIELLRLETAANDVMGELERGRSDYLKDVLTRRNEAQAKLERIHQNIRAAQDKVSRTVVTAPGDGVVNKVHFKNVGGVIRPGEPILEIVPVESTLLVEANVRPADIGFVSVGQHAMVKLTTYDFSIYGGLEGTVEQVSADTFTDERGESFYTILVRTGERSLKTTGQQFTVLPGMQAEVDILTGKKTVLDYVFKPLLRARMNALTER